MNNRTRRTLQNPTLLFRAFADPTRLRILNLLRQDELCVCHLIDVLGLPQSTVSRHLAYLRRARLVDTWEEGTWNHYRLAKPAGKLHDALLVCLEHCVRETGPLKQDKRKLSSCRRRSP